MLLYTTVWFWPGLSTAIVSIAVSSIQICLILFCLLINIWILRLDYGKSFMGFTLTFHFVEVKVKERSEWMTVYNWYLMHGNNISKPAFRVYQNHEFMLATSIPWFWFWYTLEHVAYEEDNSWTLEFRLEHFHVCQFFFWCVSNTTHALWCVSNSSDVCLTQDNSR